MDQQRNLILAIALSVAIMLGFQYFYERPKLQKQQEQAETERLSDDRPKPAQGAAPGSTPGVPGVAAPAAPAPEAARVAIASPRLSGSISTRGARLDDLILADYRETVARDSAKITLLNGRASTNPYYAELGWVAAGPGVAVPDGDTVWQTAAKRLTPSEPVTMSWENGAGLKFTKTFQLDENYVFAVTQTVQNSGDQPVALHAFGLVARWGTPTTLGFYILHEGPVGVINGTLKEYSYTDLKEKNRIEDQSKGGWLGITDKYWLVALVPDQASDVKTRFGHVLRDNVDRYQVDYLGPSVSVPAGGRIEATNRIFAGAKEVRLLDAYEEKLGVARFDLAVDFGWFYFLTKPIFYVLDWMFRWLGNFGLAIMLLTVLIKLVFFPLANKSYVAMSRMKDLQPEMLKVRERHENDRQRMNQEMMALYKREKVNPAAGCLPIVIQIPVFFSLYKVLFVTIEMRHAPFYGWIKDLSVADPTHLFNLFGLIPWTPPEFLHIGVWPLIMGATMFLQTKLNPQPADPVQAKIFLFMPLIFTVMLAAFPAGLVIYWAWNNLLSIAQQWFIMRQSKKKTAAPA
ncbi:MAG: membrane protein insertase YidC [Alphaproteobacteria bacterium]|nr:membrane protein insertase YidC [Alphaproteobacteria bacterium]